MPNRPNNPKQGWLLPYAIRPLPPERAAAIAATTSSIAADESSAASEEATPEPQPA